VQSQVQPSQSSPCGVIIAIGGNQPSNKGNSAETVVWGIENLSRRVGSPIRKSCLYQTPAYPIGSGPDFVNAAAVFESELSAAQILQACHVIESEAARVRTTRWGQRTLDLDLIGYGDQVAPDIDRYAYWRDLPADQQMQQTPDALILPHPRLQDRAFVLVPMMDVAPDWRHPVSGLTTREMLDARPAAEKASICVLDLA